MEVRDSGKRVYLTSLTSKLSKINCRGMKFRFQKKKKRLETIRDDKVRRIRYQHNPGGFRKMVRSGLQPKGLRDLNK